MGVFQSEFGFPTTHPARIEDDAPAIRFGLTAIKNVGLGAIEPIINAIGKSKDRPLSRVIFALGILHMAEKCLSLKPGVILPLNGYLSSVCPSC